jgi:hypothetical protein
MNANDKADLERFRATEDRRKRTAQIRYQESLGPVKTEQQLAQEAYERNEAIWRRRLGGTDHP